MARHRTLVLMLPAVLGLVLAVVLVRVGDRPAEPVRAQRADESSGPTGGPAGSGPLPVLREWDRARAAAYAAGEPARLRDLYTSGSPAGAADVRLLGRYRSRGFRVVGMRTQVLALTALAGGPDRYRVRVTDRLVGAVAVGGGDRIALPRDRASARVLTLARGADGRWRVSEVWSAR
jgi:hypothetical protein